MVLSTRNMFKEAHAIKSRGAFGTSFTYAPVCRAGGKPSTWFLTGTRRADHLISILSSLLLLGKFPQSFSRLQESFSILFIKIRKFIMFFTFWRTHSRVENKGSVENESWNSHKIKFLLLCVGNTPTLRIITLHLKYPCSTSYYSPLGILLLYELSNCFCACWHPKPGHPRALDFSQGLLMTQ